MNHWSNEAPNAGGDGLNPRMMAGLQMAGGLQETMQEARQRGERPGAAIGKAMLDPRMIALMLQMRGGTQEFGLPNMNAKGPGGLLGGGV